jgi:putative ABC transport system ATP-binding protein
MSILDVSNLKKIYQTRFGGTPVQALTNVSFTVERGEYLAIMGESRLGQDDAAQHPRRAGQADRRRGAAERQAPLGHPGARDLRVPPLDNLGFVFQDFNLLDTFSVQDNIFLPLVLAQKPYRRRCARGCSPSRRKLRIEDILAEVPLRNFRRPEAARRRGPRAHHPSAARAGRRADRRARFPRDGRAAAAVWARSTTTARPS